MKTKRLADILERIDSGPPQVQDELAEIVLDMDSSVKGGVYQTSPEERVGIDRGLRDAAAGRFATDEQVEAALAKFRRR